MVDRLVNSEANARRIAMVESCFGSSGVSLAVPGRVLVGEGVLTKMCRKRPKARQFFLFNDILVYGNIVLGKKIYNKQHIMPLEEVSLESLDDNGQYQNGWLIRTTTKSFVVYAATATEKQEWMAHINKCVEDLLRKSGKKPVENHAAVWVPDSDATVCMNCKKTQFTLLVRRHHCRNCGAVVCGPCSSKKFLLPQQSSKPVRVCTGCYERLSRAVKTESLKTAAASASSGDNMPINNYMGNNHNNAMASSAGGSGIVAPRANPDSSGDDDSDDEGGETMFEEPRFYGALNADDSNNISLTTTATATASSLTTTTTTTLTRTSMSNDNGNNNNSNNDDNNSSAKSQLTAGGI